MRRLFPNDAACSSRAQPTAPAKAGSASRFASGGHRPGVAALSVGAICEANTFSAFVGASAAFAAFAVAALVLFTTHSHFRQKVGHDKVSFDKFVARVESGSLTPETMTRLTNGWFEAQQQAQRLAVRLVVMHGSRRRLLANVSPAARVNPGNPGSVLGVIS